MEGIHGAGGIGTLQTPTEGLRDYRMAGDEMRSQHNKMRR